MSRNFGLERTLFFGLTVVALGTVLRAQGSAGGLLAGMFLVGSGVAIGNVLLPSLIKRDFPSQIGLMTGMYVTVMNVFAGLGSGISVPLAQSAKLGWRGSLAIWVFLALLGMVSWLPHLSRRNNSGSIGGRAFWGSSVAWQITLFMGLQSLLFYANIAWLPTLLNERGLSLSHAGWVVSLVQIISLPGTFIMPILAQRQRTQHSLTAATALLFLIGYVGLLMTASPTWSILWVIFIGFGNGVSISLALAFFSLRTRNHQNAGQISGMAQSVGYLLAATGPITIGYLHAATHAWTWPLIILMGVVGLVALTGFGASRDIFIDADEEVEIPEASL